MRSPTIRNLAEDAFAYIEGPLIEFERHPELVLRNMPNPEPSFGMALRPRLRDVDAGIDRARRWFADRGRDSYTWLVSDASRPSELVDRLLAAGAVPDEQDPVLSGMVLEREPAAVEGVEVRKVRTFEEHRAAVELGWRSFGFTEKQKAVIRPKLRERYDAYRDFEGADNYIALLDGQIVGTAAAAYLESGVYLVAGNVAEEARGQGVYRALVRARWDEAVRRKTPALVVQAGGMSKPILERLGFETFCAIYSLVDSTASSAAT